jgi:nitroreductase
MDTYLAVASKRDERRYSDRPVPDDVRRRILDGGRLAGSARNRQPWRFLVVADRELKNRLAETVYAPDNVRGCDFAVAILGEAGIDIGRALQNMLLVAWNDGVVSCPNGMPDPGETGRVLGLTENEPVAIVVSFGWPAKPRDPESRTAEEWSARANRKPLEEITMFL